MTKRRNIARGILLAVFLVLTAYSLASAKRNYNYGDQIRSEASTMSIQFYQLADAITFLENTVTKDRETLGADRLAYDSAMLVLRTHFGSDDAPLTESVRSDWIDEIEKWYKETTDDSGIISIFNDEVLRSDFSVFKEELLVAAAKLDYVYQRYQNMTTAERYLSNWRLEKRLLSESVALNTGY